MLEISTDRKPKLNSIANLFAALHQNDILYCNLKGNDQHLHTALSGESDIDILFDVSQKVKLETILSKLGFKEFVALRQNRFKDIFDFFALDSESGKVVHLHTYYGFTIGQPFLKEYQPDIARHILKGRVYNHEFGLYCIQPALELTLLYLTETLKLRHRDYIRHCLKNDVHFSKKVIRQHAWLRARTSPAQVEDTIRTVFPDQAVIVRLVESAFNPKKLQQLAPEVRQALEKYKLYSSFVCPWIRWYREASVKIRRKLSRMLPHPILSTRLNPRGGMIVAIMEGGDAFTSTLIHSLKDTFAKKLDVYHVSFRPRKTRAHSNSGLVRKNRLIRHIQNILAECRRLKKLTDVRLAKKKGALVICDQYPLNHFNFADNRPFFTDRSHSKNRISSFLASIELKSYIRTERDAPHLVFYFGSVEPVVPIQKPAVDPRAALDIITGALKKPTMRTTWRTVTIEAGKTLGDTLSIVRYEIWKHL